MLCFGDVFGSVWPCLCSWLGCGLDIVDSWLVMSMGWFNYFCSGLSLVDRSSLSTPLLCCSCDLGCGISFVNLLVLRCLVCGFVFFLVWAMVCLCLLVGLLLFHVWRGSIHVLVCVLAWVCLLTGLALLMSWFSCILGLACLR